MAGEVEFADHVRLQRTEGAAERDVLLGCQVGPAKEQDAVLAEGPLQARENFRRGRPRQVEAGHFGPAGARERLDADHQFGVTPAARMSLPSLSISARTNRPNSSGVEGLGTAP